MWFLVPLAVAQVPPSTALVALHGEGSPATLAGSASWDVEGIRHTLYVTRVPEEGKSFLGGIVYAGDAVVAKQARIVGLGSEDAKLGVDALELGPGLGGALVSRGEERWILHPVGDEVVPLAHLDDIGTVRVKSCVSTCEIHPGALASTGYFDLIVAPVDRRCGALPPASACVPRSLRLEREPRPAYVATEVEDAVDALRAGRLALVGGDIDNAEVRLTSCGVLAPEIPQCWWELGWAATARSDAAGAVEAWERVESLNPHFPELAEHLGRARAKR